MRSDDIVVDAWSEDRGRVEAPPKENIRLSYDIHMDKRVQKQMRDTWA
jgi:hypothetical protein